MKKIKMTPGFGKQNRESSSMNPQAKISINKSVLALAALLLLPVVSAWADANLKAEALDYRKKGYQAQQAGDIEMAMVYYRKASMLDSFYAIPHNDMGIIYEIKGYLNKAEEEYLTAVKKNPEFAEAHMNLALLYERMNQIDKALPHFIKRVELGNRNDAWTKRAWQKLWNYAPEQARETEARVLAREVAGKMQEQKESNKITAEKHYQKGIYYLKQKIHQNAYEELKSAVTLAPDNNEYQIAYKKAHKEYLINQIKVYSKNGIDYIQSDDYVKAKQELEKIFELMPRE
ncbi:MAG: hypothetical protein PHQ54_01030 [Candidatus Omnitrophica bacterium]|nr:hypothetical protein [Candidatus Omnitrophota bacterium]